MDNNGKNFSVIKTGVYKILLSLRGVADDEVIHNHTCIFWIATKIFDFLAMTSVCVNTDLVPRPFSCHSENVEK